VKNNFSTNFYKAYTLWKSALEEDAKYKSYIQSLQNKTSGENSLSGVVGNKVLDLEWLERIEDALPYMDKAIRESRSFIEQKDEIVPIEKVKRINTQSIRHLAQHTNLIARVEKNNEVKPEKILNIYYESSSAIYENRFLFTLLGRLNDFVTKRYNELKNKDERIEIKYDMNKSVRRKNKLAKMSLEFEYKMQDDNKTIDLNEDVSHLSGFSRVVRIRRIISDFYSLPLIKALHGVELVKPPIIQTNLMAKNVNFRTCNELWDYIARYNKKGFMYEDKEFTGKMPKKTGENLSDVFVFTNFLTEIIFNTSFKRQIEKEYKEEVRIEKAEQKEKERLEKERQKEILEEKIRAAIEKNTAPLHKKIESLEEKNKKLQFKYDALYYKHNIMIDMANDVMRQHQLIEQEQQSIRNLRDNIINIEQQIKAKKQAIATARHTLNQAQYPITQEVAEQKIKERREQALREKVLHYQEKKQQELKEAIKLFQQQKLQEFKEEVLKYQEKEKEEWKVLPVKIDGFEEDEIEMSPIEDDEFEEEVIATAQAQQNEEEFSEENSNIIPFHTPTEVSPNIEEEMEEKDDDEQELEELLKMLKEMQGS
jgi:hypothetical protein